MQRRDANPAVYKNTLYRQVDEPQHMNPRSLLNRVYHPPARDPYAHTNLYNYDTRPRGGILSNPLVATLLRNPGVLIILVVIFSYLISFIAGSLLKMDSGMTGVIEMIVAL